MYTYVLYFLSGYSFDFLFQALVPACFISIYYSIEVRHGLISKHVRDSKKWRDVSFPLYIL